MARPRSDIAPRILHAARARFLSDGVDGASLRSIARDARTSIGMIYYYFPTKDHLFLAVVEEVYAALLADMSVALAPGAPVEDRILRLYERVGAMSEDELQVVRLVMREALTSSARLEKILGRFSRGHLPLVLQTLLDGVSDGSITPAHPAVLLMAAFGVGFLPQFVRRAAGDRFPIAGAPQGRELSDALAGILFRGIGTRPARP